MAFKYLVLFALLAVGNAIIPNYINVCKRSEPDISACILKSINSLRGKVTVGIPELGVPPIEPLLLDRIILRSNVQSNITDLKVYGPSQFEITELKAEVDKSRFAFVLKLPSLYFTGKYEIDMKISILELKGQGPISGNLTDYACTGLLKGHKVNQNGKQYLKFDPMKITIIPGKSYLKLDNLYNGDENLGKATNDVINDNPEVFLKEILPTLEKSLSEKFTDIGNKITLGFTYDELFPTN